MRWCAWEPHSGTSPENGQKWAIKRAITVNRKLELDINLVDYFGAAVLIYTHLKSFSPNAKPALSHFRTKWDFFALQTVRWAYFHSRYFPSVTTTPETCMLFCI